MALLLKICLLCVLPSIVMAESPKVYLNHVMVTLPSSVVDSLSKNEFLKQHFSRTLYGSNSSGGFSWTGFYLMGEQTYLEFMSPSPQFPEKSLGLALSTEDQTGDITLARGELERVWAPQNITQQQMDAAWNGAKIPWFTMVHPVFSREAFFTWVMEYDEKFLETTRPGLPELWGITRLKSNAPSYLPDLMFKNVTAIRMRLDPQLLVEEEKTLRALGFQLIKAGISRELKGNDLSVLLEPGASGEKRLLSVQVELNKLSPGPSLSLANGIELSFNPSSPLATFVFAN
jgi:hypothetical protein